MQSTRVVQVCPSPGLARRTLRTFPTSFKAAKTSGGRVYWIRWLPPCPKYRLDSPRNLNNVSVSGLTITCTSLATSSYIYQWTWGS